MKTWSRKKRWLVGGVIGLLLIPVLFFGAGIVLGPMNLFHAHEHCIKNTGLVFDRYPTRGGDHFRRPWGPLAREVALLDGSSVFLREEAWPAFQSNQIELLVLEGFGRAEAEKIYSPPAR